MQFCDQEWNLYRYKEILKQQKYNGIDMESTQSVMVVRFGGNPWNQQQ